MRARLLYVFCTLAALAFPAPAEDRRGGGSLDRVLPQIRRTVPGTFYDAEGPFLTPDGRATYRIKWMTPDGRIVWFTVDARSGQILGGMPVQQSRPRFRDDDDSGWGDRRSNFGDDGGNRWNDDRGNWGNDRGDDRGHDRGGRGNDRGGRGDRDNGRGGHDRRLGG